MRALVLALFAAACHPAPPPSPPIRVGPPVCTAKPELAPERTCAGMFTADGSPCVACGGAAACYDAATGVYCVAATCDDPACSSEPENVPGRHR